MNAAALAPDDARRPLARTLARLLAGLGIAADALLFVLKAPGPIDTGLYAFALWLASPWLLVLFLAWWRHVPGLLAGTVLAALFEALAFHLAFIAPAGAAAALVYAAKPLPQFALIGGAMLATARRARRPRG